MGKQNAPVLDTTLAGISGIKGLPALSATAFNDLPLAIFKRKLLLLDLLLQRIILSDNPKFVVSYVKLLDELEAYIRMCNERAGVPVPKYMAKPKPQKQTSRSKPPTAKQQATQSHPQPKPALTQHTAPAAKPENAPKVEPERVTATAVPGKPEPLPPGTFVFLEDFPEFPDPDFPSKDVADLVAKLRKIQAAYVAHPVP